MFWTRKRKPKKGEIEGFIVEVNPKDKTVIPKETFKLIFPMVLCIPSTTMNQGDVDKIHDLQTRYDVKVFRGIFKYVKDELLMDSSSIPLIEIVSKQEAIAV